MNTCATCVHWCPLDQDFSGGDYASLRARRNALGLCKKIGDEKDRSDPAEDAWTVNDPMLPPDGTLAMAEDASGLQSMRTAATFGCVLWEAK